MSRPTTYTRARGERVCREMQAGRTLRDIEKLDDMPSRWTVCRWRRQFPQFEKAYAQAREMLHDHWADEILSIADDGSNDTYHTEEGDERTNHDVIQRSRLRVDTRRWLLGKLRPELYGDAVALRGDPERPIVHTTYSWDESPQRMNGNGKGH